VMFSFSPKDRVHELLVLRLHLDGILCPEDSFEWYAVTPSCAVSVGLRQFYWNNPNRL